MKLSKSVAELQREHVVMELECIDRMYLNAYVPQLTTEAGESDTDHKSWFHLQDTEIRHTRY